MAPTTAPKGMNDILPGAAEAFLDSALWDFVHEKAAQILGSYGYRSCRLPIVEETQLFARGLGEATDIVAKEMYSFEDRGGRSLTLRPEGTAGAVRAYVQHNYARQEPIQRWWYAGPMFRAERPQKGRYRQFYQIGAELLGVDTPLADAEMVLMLKRFCDALGLDDIQICINTLGDAESRATYRQRLQEFLRGQADKLCENCVRRTDENPLRVLDCKRPSCKEVLQHAPDILDSLTDAARQHFDAVKGLLNVSGLEPHRDPRLVRGLDYYTGVIFEFRTRSLGAQDAVLGGGRYDDLVAELGGPSIPAIGFAVGVERLALLIAQSQSEAFAAGPELYIIPMTQDGAGAALQLAEGIRQLPNNEALRVEVDAATGKMKKRLRQADRSGARAVIVLGEDELATGRGRLKDLRGAQEVDVAFEPAAVAAAFREF